jgi:Holliday junction resolvase-like predicted endonuclease
MVHWAAGKGLRDDHDDSLQQRKHAARCTGIRGETYACWYLRRHGYVFVARNYTPRGVKGELDLVGYDGETLAFVEARKRCAVRATMIITSATPPKSACTKMLSAHNCKTRLHTRYNAQLNSCSADSAVWCMFEEACFAGVA